MTRTNKFLMMGSILLGRTFSGSAQNMPAVVAAPSYQGFHLPTVGGELHYALSASESFDFGYNGSNGNASFTSFSGDLAYLSSSQSHPFSAVYAGGYSISTSGAPSAPFQSLSVSQVARAGRWNFIASDSVSYLPQTASTGLSGVPGQGDLGVNPIQIVDGYGQGVLTNYATQLTNTASLTVSRRLTGRDSLSGSGAWSIERFIGNSPGLDSSQDSGTASFNHQINRLNSVGVSYSYSNSSYGNSAYDSNLATSNSSFVAQTFSADYSRTWSRHVSTNISVGPQRVSGDFGTFYTVSANASLSYLGNGYNAGLAFSRNTNAGYGVTTGTLSDSTTATASRRLGPVWNVAGSFAYTSANGLPTPGADGFTARTLIGSGQLSRGIGESFSAYGSYTAQRQLLGNAGVAVDPFSGLTQVVGFGVTYAPRSIKFISH